MGSSVNYVVLYVTLYNNLINFSVAIYNKKNSCFSTGGHACTFQKV